MHPGPEGNDRAPPEEGFDKLELTMGLVSDERETDHDVLASFVAFLNLILDDQEIHLTPFLAKTSEEMQQAITNHEVDIYLDSPFGIYRAVRRGHMEVIARQWRDGLSECNAFLVARRESAFQGLKDLDRVDVAFSKPGSSTSFFLPAAEMAMAGYTLLNGDESPSPAGIHEVRFFFSGQDQASLDWLLEGRVDLAAVSSVHFSTIAEKIRRQVRIVHETRHIPRHLVAVRSTLDAEIKDLILAVLSDLEASVRGRGVLQDFYETRRFDPVPDEAELRERLTSMMDSLSHES